MKPKNVLVIILFFSLILSCSDSEKESGITTPSDIDPYIIDAVLCIDVINGIPVGITEIFIEDDIIHIWIEWDNIYDRNTVAVNWINPDGEIDTNDSVTFTSKGGRKVTWFSLKPGKPVKKGFWEVEILLNDNFMRSYLFEIV